MNKIVTILGRGSSGSRLIAQTLQQSGFFMGKNLNESLDKKPYEIVYELTEKIINRIIVKPKLNLDHVFYSRTFDDINKIRIYLKDIFCHPSNLKAWKLPETTFLFPWLTDLYPEIYYIYWVRNPRRNAFHLSDYFLHKAGILENNEDVRFWSWYIQNEIIQQTEKPSRFITVRFEDFITNQEHELNKLSKFLGVELVNLIVDPKKIQYENWLMPEKVKKSAEKLKYY